MRDTVTCLRQSGIPLDQENEFITKNINSPIGVNYLTIKVQCIYISICQRVMLKHMAFSIPNQCVLHG